MWGNARYMLSTPGTLEINVSCRPTLLGLTIGAPKQYGNGIPTPSNFNIMRKCLSRSQFSSGSIEPEVSYRGVYGLVRRPTENDRIHMVLSIRCHIMVEIVHEILPLHALITSVSDLSGKEFDNAPKWRYREERADPGIVYLGLWRHRVSDIRNQ